MKVKTIENNIPNKIAESGSYYAFVMLFLITNTIESRWQV